jgi:SET domain-containing protein
VAVPTYVKKSHIHGRGLFAMRRIPRGERIGRYAGEKTRRNGRYVLWVPLENGRIIGIAGRNTLRYVNHSRRPNATFHGADLYALRSIGPHEEITVDYGRDWLDVD